MKAQSSKLIRKVPEKEVGIQYQDFTERIKRLGNASSDELEKALLERESVEPEPGLSQETVLRLKNRIDEARNVY